MTTTGTPSSASPLYDLRTFFRNVGTPPGGGLTSAPQERKDRSETIELVDHARAKLTGPPLEVAGFVDGIQSALVVTYRNHRPIYLAFQASGAVGRNTTLVGLKERLSLLASDQDLEWVAEVNTAKPSIPVEPLQGAQPYEVEASAFKKVGALREQLEHQLVLDLVKDEVGNLVLDGSLRRRPHNAALHAVVKDVTSTRYLPQEEEALYGLPQGWRSPIFKIPNPFPTGPDVYSCYIRLHDATQQSWNFGLVRIEAFTPEALTPLGVLALSERQGPRSGDGRWDRHLASVAITEKVMRSRRPNIFD